MSSFEQPQREPARIPKRQEVFFVQPPIERDRKEYPLLERVVCVSDVHNDKEALVASLRERNLVDERGEWRLNLNVPIRLMITGDSINQNDPNYELLKFLKHLKKTAPEGVSVTLLVGNHELELLAQITKKKENILKEKWIGFLGTWGVVSRSGPVLFIHRYPTIELVLELQEQWVASGGYVPDESWKVNRRYQQAVAEIYTKPEQSRTILQACDDGGGERALRGQSFEEYYRHYGLAIGEALRSIGITTVVHGHRRQREGGQQLEQVIPGILMINNDAAISNTKNPEHVHRIGSVDITASKGGGIDATCVYQENTHLKKSTPLIQNVTIH